jgi:hypothetical protein
LQEHIEFSSMYNLNFYSLLNTNIVQGLERQWR